MKLNLAYRWFCRLSIKDQVPNHSTISKDRHGRFRESDALRRLFEQTVDQCISQGMVGGEGFAVDASVIRTDAHFDRAIKQDNNEDWPRPGGSSRAVREYLEASDKGAKPSKRVSTIDPGARQTAAPGGPAFFTHSTNYLIDVDARIIVDVEATPAHRSREVDSTKDMIDRVQQRFNMKPKRLMGGTAYGTAEMLA
ncbi:MAG: transposase [Pseudomonadota bacterium]